MYTKYQIALQYSPELFNHPTLAVRRLRIMIDRCTELKEALVHSGHNSYNKTFTPQQVKLIYRYLGDPPIRCSNTSLFDKYISEETD